MSYNLQYQCDNCGRIAWAAEEPEEWDCPCYDPMAEKLKECGFEPTHPPMNKTECNARYRHQYQLNGNKWFDDRANWMFLGKFDIYPDRTKEFE